jgi:type V secretory pathway adhesin AidA
MKQQAGMAYGVTDSLSDYQGDHLIPLELGGATSDLANFWDQPNRQRLDDGTVVTSDQKDALENTLKSRVCAGQMTLLDAQRQIATDWYAASTAMGSIAPPASTTTTTSTQPAPTSSVATTAVATTAPRTTTAPVAAVTSPPATSPASCPNGTYVNVSGNTVCSPYAATAPPAGATAQCNDGTYSMSQHRQGTCSGHNGVRAFLVNLP